MASVSCTFYAGLSYGRPASSAAAGKRRRMVAVRAETVNPDIRKTEDKVVDSVLVTELSKPVTAYCRELVFSPSAVVEELHEYVNKSEIRSKVLEVQDLSRVRWNASEAQQSYWG